MTFDITCHTAVMMREPPCAPKAANGCPLASTTMVGYIDDSMRLPGAILFTSPWTRP